MYELLGGLVLGALELLIVVYTGGRVGEDDSEELIILLLDMLIELDSKLELELELESDVVGW